MDIKTKKFCYPLFWGIISSFMKYISSYMQAEKNRNANYSMWQELNTKVSFVQTLVSNGI